MTENTFLTTLPIEYVTRSGYTCTLSLTASDGVPNSPNLLSFMGCILTHLDHRISFGIVQLTCSTGYPIDTSTGYPIDTSTGSSTGGLVEPSTVCTADLIIPASQYELFQQTLCDIKTWSLTDLTDLPACASSLWTIDFSIDDSEEEVDLVLSGNSQRRVLSMMNLLPCGIAPLNMKMQDENWAIEVYVAADNTLYRSILAEKLKQLADLVCGSTERKEN